MPICIKATIRVSFKLKPLFPLELKLPLQTPINIMNTITDTLSLKPLLQTLITIETTIVTDTHWK